MKFNKEQEQLAMFREGHCLTLASAGSGKSTTILERTKRMVLEGIDPHSVLILTFSRKAVADLKVKIKKDVKEIKDINVSTFHSFCTSVLKNNGDTRELVKRWQIEKLFSDKYGEEFPTGELISWISYQKSFMHKPNGKFAEKKTNIEIDMNTLYIEYRNYLIEHHFMDYDDMLVDFIELIREKPEAQKWFTDTYKYIMVDEHQDSSRCQNEILRLISGAGNLVCIADIKQCLTPETILNTTDGDKRIEDIVLGDMVKCASGRGDVEFGEVETVSKTHKEEKIVKITTKSKKEIRGTMGHVLFVDQVINDRDFIYLMYKDDIGFRIGKNSNNRMKSNTNRKNGYYKRLTDENADRVWLLKSTSSQEDTFFWEHYLAYTYGIPQYQFKSRNTRNSQSSIDSLFKAMPIENGYRILSDFNLLFELPHYTREFNSKSPHNLTFTMFGNHVKANSNGYLGNKHELISCTTNLDYVDELKKLGMSVPKSKNGIGTEYYGFRRVVANQDDLSANIDTILESLGDKVNLKTYAVLTKNNIKYEYVEMRNIREGMSLATVDVNGEVVVDEIVSVEYEDYSGFVYDINIKQYRNYVANGIVSHNCIYNFRGSDLTICLDFEKDWDNATVINLPTNYRSTRDIVDVSNGFIRPSFESYENYVDSNSSKEHSGVIHVGTDSTDVVSRIKTLVDSGVEPKDIAILYRMNYLSGAYELGLRELAIPCTIVEDKGFTERVEIDVILSYLKLAINNKDYKSFSSVFNMPNRYLGKSFTDEIKSKYGTTGIDYMDMYLPKLKGFQKNGYNSLKRVVNDIDVNASPISQIESLIERSGMMNYLKSKYDDYEEKSRAIAVLKAIAKKHKTIKQFLFMVEAPIAKKTKNAVQLMTVHKSKGLEFEHVFVVNVDTKIFPHERAEDEEERRLFYVAISRAISGLYVYGTSNYVDELDEVVKQLT